MPDYYLGLMSGTSMDAIDAALIDCSDNQIQLIAHHSHTLSDNTRQQINALCLGSDNEIQKMMQLDNNLGQQFASTANELIKKNKINKDNIAAIGSHGQTIRHYPQSPINNSLQIANPNIIAEQTGITTVADFRRRDMAVGGEGAPLVPAFHKELFHDPDKNTAVINIGGIANITVIPADPLATVTGFDTGPGNGLLDAWTQKNNKGRFDKDGHWAASGKANTALLKRLLKEPYFKLDYPKSTGRELFNIAWLEKQLTNDNSSLATEDVQASLIKLTVSSIASAIEQLPVDIHRILVCGGGANNPHLMQQLQAHINTTTVTSTSSVLIDPDWIESMAFAWLARQTLEHATGNVPSVTGATKSVILGSIYPV